MQYKYLIKQQTVRKVRSFYRNMHLKYRHVYSYEDRLQYIENVVNSIYQIEKSLPRRKPTVARWQGYHMAHAGHWYYAYSIQDETIIIEDACHEQNMHN